MLEGCTGAIRKTETVVLVEREAERKVGSRGCRMVGCRESLVCQCDDAGCVLNLRTWQRRGSPDVSEA